MVTYTTDRYGFAEHRDAWYQQKMISEITQLAVAIGVKVKLTIEKWEKSNDYHTN